MELLWHIFAPECDWDRENFINGRIIYDGPALPVAVCEKCGPFGISSGLIPTECPLEILDEITTLSTNHSHISLTEFRQRAVRWESVLRRHGVDFKLQPAEHFMPIRWRIPSIPRYDLFWPSIGITISERFRQFLVAHRVTGPAIYPVALGPVGLAESDESFELPESLYFDDEYFETTSLVRDPSECGDFFNLRFPLPIPSTEIGIVSKCDNCGYIQYEFNPPQPEADHCRENRVLPRKYIQGTDAFRTEVFFRGFMIRDWVRKLLPDEYLLNCEVEPIRVIDG